MEEMCVFSLVWGVLASLPLTYPTYIYEGSSISFLVRYEELKLEILNFAHIFLDMYRGAMQEFVFL